MVYLSKYGQTRILLSYLHPPSGWGGMGVHSETILTLLVEFRTVFEVDTLSVLI